jgi:hypothetical protein
MVLMHLSFFSSATTVGEWNYFVQQLMLNPSLSIHDPAIKKALTPPEPDVRLGWEKEVRYDGRAYRLFPPMMHPEPREEIQLTSGFEESLIEDIRRYFFSSKVGALLTGS